MPDISCIVRNLRINHNSPKNSFHMLHANRLLSLNRYNFLHASFFLYTKRKGWAFIAQLFLRIFSIHSGFYSWDGSKLCFVLCYDTRSKRGWYMLRLFAFWILKTKTIERSRTLQHGTVGLFLQLQLFLPEHSY